MSVFPTLNQIGYVIRGGITYPARFLPEGRLKNAVRLRLLTFQNSCPKFLMANRGDIAIQVGTPKPSTMRQLSRYAGRRGRVVIIEADPGNAATLMGAMRSLRHQNVRIIPKGAWSSRTRLTLSRSPDPAAHKIAVAGIEHDNDYRPENTYEDQVEIEVDTLDNIAKEEGLGEVDYLSVTVNGAELEVLKGAEFILHSPNLRIYSKGHARYADGTPINKTLRRFLEQRGFQVQISKGEPAVGTNSRWLVRDGDVYAYRSGAV